MMNNVRVYNDNVYPYRENFRGNQIDIPPGGYIDMDYYEAIDFRGTYCPIKTDGGGKPLAESFKLIRIVQPENFQAEDAKRNICNSCGKSFPNAKDLEDHINENHINEMIDDKEREKRLKARAQK
jgi:uncharacterized C2H2 Zn-finger protein